MPQIPPPLSIRYFVGAGENVDSENANEDNSDNLVDENEKETETETVKVDVLKRKHSVAGN